MRALRASRSFAPPPATDAQGHIHEIWRGFSYDLPVMVEVIDDAAKIDAFVPTLQRLRQGALVIRQRVKILEPCGPAAAQ